ncbi:hypothetical protein K493DRAFT_298915 [Basidiobolus meristosporus CBS 931.73]|uniref:Thioredoxin domain-containing protein n=1 Tax=Basidiobolus meristosporus CBS 931.73 TaxID=1314790 RepID=A0A1Y1YQW4_9FUNG|nr:hypothetical protein K493DRAFT_298915 [Basidiobolus meristosporus CBS 931.73]|eukprot:ORY00428.1 hypothetical protein K493DRAFT_298915 [Basidiobolus meristosporus CBS 931.73]
MDATANDIPVSAGFQIQGFPTIKLFKAGKGKEIVDYDGDRTEESFVEFLKENASNKVDVEVEVAKPTPKQEAAEKNEDPELRDVLVDIYELTVKIFNPISTRLFNLYPW